MRTDCIRCGRRTWDNEIEVILEPNMTVQECETLIIEKRKLQLILPYCACCQREIDDRRRI